MTWKFTGKRTRTVDGKAVTDDVQPLAGIGEGPFTDKEFAVAVSVYEAQFGEDAKGAVRKSGLYSHEDDPKVEERA